MKKHSPLALLLIGFLLLAWHPAPAQGDPARQQGTTVDPAVARRALITGSILPGDQARAPRDEASRAPALIAPPAGGTGPAVKLATPLTYSSNRAGDFDIYRQQEVEGNATALTGPPAGEYTPFWSPDGRYLLYTGIRDGNADIYLRDAGTGGEQQLTTSEFDDIHPAWSPDGQQIIFSSDRSGRFQVYTMDPQGNNVQRVGEIDGHALYPRFAPDGLRISYMRASVTIPACDWNWDIWLMDPTGDNQVRATTQLGGDLYANWTPDGQLIYSSCRTFLFADLYRLDPVSAVEEKLTGWSLAHEMHGTYNPVDNMLAFNSNVSGDDEIYVVPAGAAEATNFTRDAGTDVVPSWQWQSSGTFSLSGRIAFAGFEPLVNATIRLDNGASALTDVDGRYTFTGLLTGTYTITPESDPYYFLPPSYTVSLPPDRAGLDFTAVNCEGATNQDPLLLVPGWGAADTLQEDGRGFNYLLPRLESAGYRLNCNLFYAGRTSAAQGLVQNAIIIRDTLCAAAPMVRQLLPGWDGSFDLIGHSYGGMRIRAYLEDPGLYGQECPGSGEEIKVNNLFTLGSPHGGGTPDLFGAFLIGLGHVVHPEEWVSVSELMPWTMNIYNATHRQPDEVCYRAISGDAWEQPVSHALLGLLYSEGQKQTPNDLGVYRWSAHILRLWPDDYPRLVTPATGDVHGFVVDSLDSYMVDAHLDKWSTFDTHVAPYLGKGVEHCISDRAPAPAEAPQVPPVPSTMIAAGVVPAGTTAQGSFSLPAAGRTTLYLNWPLGSLGWTLTDPGGHTITPAIAAADPDVDYLALELLGYTGAYVITGTVQGTWHYQIDAPAAGAEQPQEIPFRVVALHTTPVALTATATPWQAPGGSVVISGTLTYSATTPLAGATVNAAVSRPDGVVDAVPLYDDGAHADGAAADGTYGTFYPAAAGGHHAVEVTAAGVYNTLPYTRTALTGFAVASAAATLGDEYAGRPLDEQNDGAYEALLVDVQIKVTQPGTYTLAAELHTAGGQQVGHSLVTMPLVPGSHTLTLSFAGPPIAAAGVDGPYRLANLRLLDAAAGQLLLAEVDEAYTTAAYDHTLFAPRLYLYLPALRR